MKNFFKLSMLLLAGAFLSTGVFAQANASLNLATLQSGDIYINGAGLLNIAVNNTGPSASIPLGRLQVQISAPTTLSIPTGQTITGWTITYLNAQTVNICNSGTVIPVGGVANIQLALLGGPVGSTGQSIGGQISFRTNCTAPGSLAGDNPADNSATAGFNLVPAPACAIGVTAAAGTIACNGGTTTLTATTSGTSNTVEYSLNGGAFQSAATFTVTAGSYTVTAREVATPACTATSSSVTVGQPSLVVASGSVTTPIATTGGNGVITVTGSGGTAPYTGTGTFTVAAGTYNYTVTDANGCTATTSVTINNPAACIITGVTATAGTILCNAGTTTLTATASPAGAYQYSVNGGAFQAGNTFVLPAGTYTVTARETANTSCSVTSSSVVVAQPAAISVTGTFSPICFGGTSTVTISATGGTGTLTGTGTFTQVAGTQSYTVTDASGCTGTVSVTVTQPAQVATPTITSVGNGSGGFTLTAAGFTGTLLWSTGATTPSITVTSAGTYTVTQTIAGCTSAAASITVTAGVTVADPAVGQMYFTTTSGGAQSANTLLFDPFSNTYRINIPFYNLNQLNAVPNGTIRFSVNLGSKLVLATPATLAASPLNAFFAWTSSVVAGNVIVTGTQIATIPADFDNIATFVVKGSLACRSNIVSNITIVNLSATLTDEDLQNNAATLQYTLPISVTTTQVNITCSGAANGIINVLASPGTRIITTNASSTQVATDTLIAGDNTTTISNLAPGTYTITATAGSDGLLAGCSASTTVTISQPAPLVASVTGTLNNACFGSTSGSIFVTSVGGTAPYTYVILSGPTVNTTGATSGVFTGLAAGTYTIRSTDSKGCQSTTTSTVTQPVGGVPDISLGSDIDLDFGNFAAPGVTHNIVYNISELNGNSAVGDTLRITKVAGFNINFNPAAFLYTPVGSATTYTLDNSRWKIDNSNPAFVSIILKNPSDPVAGPFTSGTLTCLERVNLLVSVTRVTSNISTFTISARLRQTTGETNLSNNFNSLITSAD